MAMLCLSISAVAYDFEVDGIFYDIDAAARTAVVTNGDTPYTGEIIVPDVISINNRDLMVVSVGQAFHNSTITSISIGKNISEIQFGAFDGCNSLREIYFLPSETAIKINNKKSEYFGDEFAHIGCFYKLPLEKIVFGRSVIVTTSGSNYISDGSPFIYSNYYGIKGKCTTLREVVFNGSCDSIPEAICGYSSIQSLVIGESVREIGSDAFINCNSLEQIQINNIDAFASIKFSDTPQKGRYLYDEEGNVITSLVLQASLISSKAFSGVKGIESIILDDNVISVESNAFNSVPSLKTVKIMGSNTKWGYEVFANNLQLEEIELNQLNSIGYSMFENCPAIKALSCPNVKIIDAYAFDGCNNLENISAPILSSLGSHAFANTKLNTINLPLVKIIDAYAFDGCNNLETINAPILSSLGSYAFANTKLNTINLPSISRVGNYVFSNCDSLLNVDFGIRISTLGENIFDECKNLSSVTIKSLNPPTSNNSFTNFIYVNTTLNVPELSVEEYKSSSPWSNFFEINSIQLNYYEVDRCLYYVDGSTGVLISVVDKDVKTLNIPQSIICNNESVIVSDCLETCFQGLTSLKTLTLPSSFYDLPPINMLSTLEEVSINSMCIPENYFSDLENLAKINLGSNIVSIGNNAFKNCESLRSIQIPAACVEIGTDAFGGCSKLSNVIFDTSSQVITLGYNSTLNLSSSITPFPNPSDVDEKRTGFKNGYYNGLFYGLPIERLVINRNIELSKYYERIMGNSTSSYSTVYNDIVYYPPFYGLKNLKYLEIGENVSAICKNNIEAVVNAVPTTMEYTNFGQCDNIEVVVSNNPNAPIGGGFSQTVYKNAFLFLPNGGIDSYKSDDYWKNFADINGASFIPIESISFESDEVTIDINESKTLNPIINPSEASIRNLKWSSSNASIVNVSEDGIITTSSRDGEAIITATTCDGSGVSASIKVIVQESAGISDVVVERKIDISIKKDGCILISGKSETDIVEIFNIQGELITTSTSNIIAINSKGVYLVKIGSVCKKIIL